MSHESWLVRRPRNPRVTGLVLVLEVLAVVAAVAVAVNPDTPTVSVVLSWFVAALMAFDAARLIGGLRGGRRR